MIQIRQKKQTFHNQRRRQQLQTFFKNVRDKRYNKQKGAYEWQDQQTQIVNFINNLNEKCIVVNESISLIRQKNLLGQMQKIVNKLLLNKNVYFQLCLLTVIGNIFKDSLNLDQQTKLLRLSLKIVKSLNFSKIYFQTTTVNNNIFIKISEGLNVFEVLGYYMAQVIGSCDKFQQFDQIQIQNWIYPLLVDVIFLSLDDSIYPQISTDYLIDIKKCLYNVFKANEQIYEMGNRYKSKRNNKFFQTIMKNHLNYLQKFKSFGKKLSLIQASLFQLYVFLITFYQENQVRIIIDNKMVIQIIRKTLKSKLNQNTLFNICKILSLFIQKNLFIQQIKTILRTPVAQSKQHYTYKAIFQLSSYNSYKSIVLQFLELLVFSYTSNDYFSQLFESQFTQELVGQFIRIVLSLQINQLYKSSVLSNLTQILSMIANLVYKGNLVQRYKVNKVSLQLHRVGFLKTINQFVNQINLNKDSGNNATQMDEFLQIVDEIQSQLFEFDPDHNYDYEDI